MTSIKSIPRPLILATALALSFGASPVMADLLGKSELSGTWKERFQDVSKLKAYTDTGGKVNLSEITIGDFDLTGAVFEGATFQGDMWNETSGTKMIFSNTTFRSNTFRNVDLEDSVFTNVTFEDGEFYRTSFFKSRLNGVKFIRCKFKSVSFEGITQNTIDTTIVFENSTIETADFYESQANFSFDHVTITNINRSALGFHHQKSPANFSFNHSTLADISLTDISLPSSLTFENSTLKDVETTRTQFSKLKMDNVTSSGNNHFEGGDAAVVEVRNSSIGLNLDGRNFDKVTFENSKIDADIGDGFDGSAIKELNLNNCQSMTGLKLYKAAIDSLKISNCPINNLRPIMATIQNFSIEKSPIANSDFGDMKATNFTLTDVGLDKNIDFTDAHIEHLSTKNITKLPGLNLILTGSNVRF